MSNEKINLIISFATYPRSNNITYSLLERTFKSLLENQNLSKVNIKIIIVGDDYKNIDELKPIFKDYNTDFYNINLDNALRNMQNVPYIVKWKQAVQRTKIFILEKAIELNYDYILMSSDDDIYLNNKIVNSMEFIINYNYPDFVFNLGKFCKQTVIPKTNNIYSYPKAGRCISSGCIYNLKNKDFINSIIEFRKNRWKTLEEIIEKNLSYDLIEAEDYEQWKFLEPFFKSGKFKSILIPIIMINHETEGTLKKHIK